MYKAEGVEKVSEIKKRISLLAKKDALAILFDLENRPKRFSELPGNTDTRTKRLRELEENSLIEPVIINRKKRRKPVVAYKITEKGVAVLRDVEDLEKKIA